MDQTLLRRAFPFLVVLIPTALVALNLSVIPGYTSDDAFIHFTYARNLLERGTISYNTPEPSYGATSILWVSMCAAVSSVTGSIPVTGRVLSALFFLLAAILFSRYLVDSLHLPVSDALAGFLLFLMNAVLFRWMLTGMEIGLTLVVIMLLLNFWKPEHPLQNAGITLAAYLTRPEFLLLPIVVGVVKLLERRRLDSAAIRYFGMTIALFALWFVFAGFYFGSFLPLSVLKSGSGPDAASVTRYFRVLVGMYPDIVLVAIALIATGTLSARFVSGLPEAERILHLVAGAVMLVYLGKGASMISRYLLLVHPAVTILILRALTHENSRRWLKPVVVTVAVVQTLLFVMVHMNPVRSFVDGFQSTYTTVGRLLESTGGQDTGTVMLSDVGIVGYYSRRPLIDLVGLTSRHVYEAGSRDEVVLLARYHPRFAVLKLDTLRLEVVTAQWWKSVRDLKGIRTIFKGRIGPLGVFTSSGQQFDVYVLELEYTGGGPAALGSEPDHQRLRKILLLNSGFQIG